MRKRPSEMTLWLIRKLTGQAKPYKGEIVGHDQRVILRNGFHYLFRPPQPQRGV